MSEGYSPAHEQALIAKLEAETEELRRQALLRDAEIRGTVAEALKEEHQAGIAQIQLRERQRMDELTAVADIYYFHHFFDGPVSEKSVYGCLNTLNAWDRLYPESSWDITMNSPGGSVIDGMHLFDALTAFSRRRGGTHHITMTVRGYAASMGAILLQAVDRRVIGPESYLLVHEISAGASGKIGELKDDIKWYDKICDRVANLFVERSGGKITAQKFKDNWERKDWWLDSEESLELGFVDAIG